MQPIIPKSIFPIYCETRPKTDPTTKNLLSELCLPITIKKIIKIFESGTNVYKASFVKITLLHMAADNKASAPILWYIILSGGGIVYYPSIPSETQNCVDSAMFQLFKKVKILFEAIIDKNLSFNLIPYDLMELLIITKSQCIALNPHSSIKKLDDSL